MKLPAKPLALAEVALTALGAYVLGHVSADQVSEHLTWLTPDARVLVTAVVAVVLAAVKGALAHHVGDPSTPLVTDLRNETGNVVHEAKVVIEGNYPEIAGALAAALRNVATEVQQAAAEHGATVGPVTVTVQPKG